MLGFFQLGYAAYRTVANLTAPFNEKAQKWVAGRKQIYIDLADLSTSDKVLWFHAASLGEYEMGRPVLLKMKERYPEKKILVTFFSPSGYENRKHDSALDFACYLPHDQTRSVKKFLDRVNPEIAVFIKYEFWPVILKELISRKVPTSVISATFRENQFLFSNWAVSLRKLLHHFKLISVQDGRSQEILLSKGFTNVELTGDGRFDNVIRLFDEDFEHPVIEKFANERETIVGGSIWEEDEEVLLPQINRHPYFNFLLAPHDVSKSNVQRLLKRIPANAVLLSECDEQTDLQDVKVLIIDSIGVLSRAYRFGRIAYVGGGFKTGLHNILEPAVYSLPVIYGPQHGKFWEAEGLQRAGGGFSIKSQEEVDALLKKWGDYPAERETAGLAAREFILQNAGASEKTAELLHRQLTQ
ncbi:3-deoxy-D-manno-octulosonic acid transferase [Phaeocystidibacter luteus]|uniref:3-deoxy-D-manno-octulosonic acid transferase n=1 Tax=Phaeocystidibacter luteus TaxID=911197 RepID=A0A6N6RHS5_9FLAO|nr:glycosyltransferase N-terminal domain-containing protein [Phaeocystidibacter luteus]KAB2810317.1 3-deoxy-D-manno-octulosonic acid transferase [Phaeocystidibacter luteus]